MSHKGRFERQKPQKSKRNGGKIALIILAVVAVLIIALVAGVVIYYNSMLNKINRAEHIDRNLSDDQVASIVGGYVPTAGELEELTFPTETEATEATQETVIETTVPETRAPMKPEDIINVLIVGQASRKGEDARMADTTILASINKYTNTVTLSSVLRDSYVHRSYTYSGNGKSFGGIKFTTVYALGYSWGDMGGAMECINGAMKNNFGVEVDYNVEINFDMVIDFINLLGGVSVTLTQAEADYLNETLEGYPELSEGYTWMDGYMTLTYARMRKDKDANHSDIKRSERQRYLIERILHQMKKKSLPELQALIEETLPHVTTNMTNTEITKLIADVLPMLWDLKIESGTLPAEGTYSGEQVDIYDDGIPDSVLKFNPDQQKKIMAPISEGIIE